MACGRFKAGFCLLVLLFSCGLAAAWTCSVTSSSSTSTGSILWEDFAATPLNIICALYDAFVAVASALGALIIVVSGVIWISAHDDPGKRKQAKSAIIHALIGLIIVSLAVVLIDGIELETTQGSMDFDTACSVTGGGSTGCSWSGDDCTCNFDLCVGETRYRCTGISISTNEAGCAGSLAAATLIAQAVFGGASC